MDLAERFPGGWKSLGVDNARLGRRSFFAGLGACLMVGAKAQADEISKGESKEALLDKGGGKGSFSPSTSTVKARHLKKGDTVGICAPSSQLENPTELEYTYEWLKKLGLKCKLGKHFYESYSDFAGADEARLEDFHAMWADPEVKAVMPMRGGNGAARLLPRIDFDLIARNPKVICGYSDATALIVPIHQMTGLVTFHGPMMGGFFEGPYTYHNYVKAIMNNKPIGTIVDIPRKEPWNPEGPPARFVIAKGKARGRLTGGCMTVLKQMMGSRFELETEGKIVFLEDLDEEPHDIDRFLSQMLLAGKLQKAAGIIIGECVNCAPGGSKRNVFPLNFSMERVLQDRLGDLGIPVVYGMRFGHSGQKFTIPIGVLASLDVDAQGVRFKIEENATI